MNEPKCIGSNAGLSDRGVMLKMELCAEFLAHMIEKYGREVLEEIEAGEPEEQKDRLIKFAEFQKMDIVREYCDAGKSGKNITGRPEFSQMLCDVADDRDGVDYILVFKLSRFGRNAADVLNSLQYIQDFGVNLICVEDGIDSSKDSGKLTITVLSAVAEIERENILVQTMEGRKQKAGEGKWNGGLAPFGYRHPGYGGE